MVSSRRSMSLIASSSTSVGLDTGCVTRVIPVELGAPLAVLLDADRRRRDGDLHRRHLADPIVLAGDRRVSAHMVEDRRQAALPRVLDPASEASDLGDVARSTRSHVAVTVSSHMLRGERSRRMWVVIATGSRRPSASGGAVCSDIYSPAPPRRGIQDHRAGLTLCSCRCPFEGSQPGDALFDRWVYVEPAADRDRLPETAWRLGLPDHDRAMPRVVAWCQP